MAAIIREFLDANLVDTLHIAVAPTELAAANASGTPTTSYWIASTSRRAQPQRSDPPAVLAPVTVSATCTVRGMPPAWPEEEYLQLLGKLVYSVASLEGMLIFDLPRMPKPVVGLSPEALAGKTTTKIGEQLSSLSGAAGDENWGSTR